MSYVMKERLSRKENYGGKRSASNIKYIVIHYTANDGDHDESNAVYFQKNITKSSAHYFVDDDSVTRSVPDNYTAYSVGGNKYKDCSKTGGGKLYGIVKNTNSLSIELCDTKRDGVLQASEATMQNAAELCKTLMKKYNVGVDNVVRHFDVNGKHCPAYFMDEKAWAGFKNRLSDVDEKSTTSILAETKPANNTANNTTKPYVVKVDTSSLNIRTGPGTNYSISVESPIQKGTYTIAEVSSGKGSKKGWGKLKSGAGWISLDYASKA